MTYKAIIIDDEVMARNLLHSMVKSYCPEIQVVEQCKDLPEAVKAIRKHKPDLIFLDIEMPGYSGLDVFDFFDENDIDFSIIFVTAYNEYAIQAFKLSAVDYVLKPIESDDLITAVSLFVKKKNATMQNLKALQSNLNTNVSKKIALNTMNAVAFVDLKDILFLQAEGAYTKIVTIDGKTHTQSRGLKSFEYITETNSQFVRCHKSFIVNTDFVTDLVRKDGGYLLVNHEHIVSVSSEKVPEIVEKMTSI